MKVVYVELIKRDGPDSLVIAGMLNREEIQDYRKKGYKQPSVNKNGIKVV